jgi:hypothetical protein
VVLVVLLVALAAAVYGLGRTLDHSRYSGEVIAELMYFPSGKFLDVASLGFETLGADMLWLKGIQYYGEHHKTDKEYLLAEHIFSTITDLDPGFIGAYRFGAFVLAEDVGNPVLGVQLLRKGMSFNQHSWELPFDLGFIYYVHLGIDDKAASFFRLASRLEGAPEVAKRFSAAAYTRAGRLDLGKSLWQEIYDSSDNPVIRESAEFNIKRIELREIAGVLEAAVEEYRRRHGRSPQYLQDLVREGLIRLLPGDPFGGEYFLDTDSVTVLSTHMVKEDAVRSKVFLEQQIRRYCGRHAHLPSSISVLKDEGLIAEIPRVAGARLRYDPQTGTVDYDFVWEQSE